MMSSEDRPPMRVLFVFNTRDNCCSLYSTNVLLKSKGSFNLSKKQKTKKMCELLVVVCDTVSYKKMVPLFNYFYELTLKDKIT